MASFEPAISSPTLLFQFHNLSDICFAQKSYHKKASGLALATVKKHFKENDLKLYGACFW
jgi:hypothetical protein